MGLGRKFGVGVTTGPSERPGRGSRRPLEKKSRSTVRDVCGDRVARSVVALASVWGGGGGGRRLDEVPSGKEKKDRYVCIHIYTYKHIHTCISVHNPRSFLVVTFYYRIQCDNKIINLITCHSTDKLVKVQKYKAMNRVSDRVSFLVIYTQLFYRFSIVINKYDDLTPKGSIFKNYSSILVNFNYIF